MVEVNQSNSVWSTRIQSQPMFDILKTVKDRELSFPGIVHLEIGDTNGFSNDGLKQAVAKSLQHEPFTYSPSIGESFLRESLANRMATELGRGVDISEISIGPANSLITQALASVCSEGDLVLLPDPGFPTYELASNFLNLNVHRYSVYREGIPQVQPLHEIKKSIANQKISALVVCNPSNPLGYAFDWNEFRDLLTFAESQGTTVIFDETYVNLTYTGVSVKPFEYPRDIAIRIRSLSKEFAAPALRMGWCIASPRNTDVISRFSSMVYSCLPSFIQIGTANYLNSSQSNDFVNILRSEMKNRFHYLSDAASKVGVVLANPSNATFYSFIRVADEKGVFRHLLEDHFVAVCPGSAFGPEGLDSIRLSLAGPRDQVLMGIDRVMKGLSEINIEMD